MRIRPRRQDETEMHGLTETTDALLSTRLLLAGMQALLNALPESGFHTDPDGTPLALTRPWHDAWFMGGVTL